MLRAGQHVVGIVGIEGAVESIKKHVDIAVVFRQQIGQGADDTGMRFQQVPDVVDRLRITGVKFGGGEKQVKCFIDPAQSGLAQRVLLKKIHVEAPEG